MPGNTVRNWPMYHALRDQGYSKEAAARITNSKYQRKRKRTKRDRLKSAHKRATMRGD